jgi:hypothetical protein
MATRRTRIADGGNAVGSGRPFALPRFRVPRRHELHGLDAFAEVGAAVERVGEHASGLCLEEGILREEGHRLSC